MFPQRLSGLTMTLNAVLAMRIIPVGVSIVVFL